MSIEDIDYLLENSEENSITVFIDSKNRDTHAYPSPNSYVVDFSDHPIRNVFGIEILDATIPATAYTVDETTRTIGYSQVFYAPGTGITDVTNPTTFAAHIEILQHCPAFDTIFSANTPANLFCCTDQALYNDIQFTDPGVSTPNAAFYVRRVRINPFGEFSFTVTGGIQVNIDDNYVAIQGTKGNVKGSATINSYSYIFNSSWVIYIEWKYTLLTSQVNAELELISGFPRFDIFIFNNVLTLPIGSYTSDFLLTKMITLFQSSYSITEPTNFSSIQMLGSILGDLSITPAFTDNPIQGNSSITQLLQYTTKTKYPFIFDMKKTTANFILGFSQKANMLAGVSTYSALAQGLADISPDESSTFGYTTFTYLDNKFMFMSLPSISTGQTLVTPGVVNLESARYILLRCPEIESHMLGSYANFKYAPGIGLFKLTSSNSLMNLRFDFVNIVRKPFHPIGKLGKLTFSFEMQDNSLYDFKGVDHVLLISIKYYAPRNILRIPKSTLNPHYLPNILEYQLKQYKDTSIKRQLSDKYGLEEIIQEQKQYMQNRGSEI